jgi:hypothetical protein
MSPKRTRTRLGVVVVAGALFLPVQLVSAQTVTKTALDALLPTLSLKTAQSLSSMPLKGAGQKIKIQLDPSSTGITVGGSIPVTVSFSGWAVKRGTTVLTEGSDYRTTATDPVTGARTFVFKTSTYHQTTDPPPAGDALTVSATVRLTAGSPIAVTSDPRTLTLPLTVPRLGIPKVLALFRNTEFQEWKDGIHDDAHEGFVLIMVPSNSPLPTDLPGNLGQMLPFETITTLLSNLKTATDNLSQLAVGAGDFNAVGSSPVLSLFLGKISAYEATRRKIRIGGHDDFGEIEMLERFWNNVEANDEISSAIFLADKGNRAYLFNRTDYETSDGWFWLEAGDGPAMVVQVPSLVAGSPATTPSGHLDVKSSAATFNNKLSSVRFSAP